MPHSFDFFNDDVKKFVDEVLKSSRIVDIGPGAGKYGKMFKREGRTVDAVEVFPFYIDQYKLRDVYNTIFVQNVTEFKPAPGAYDLVIMGDVLEHLTVEEARGFLLHLEQSRIPVLVLVPYHYPQLASHGNEHEEHKRAKPREQGRTPAASCLQAKCSCWVRWPRLAPRW